MTLPQAALVVCALTAPQIHWHDVNARAVASLADRSAREETVPRPPADARTVARDVLRDPRFRVFSRKAAAATWWQRAWEWAGERWSRLADALLARMHVSRPASAVAADLLLLVLIACGCVAVVRLIPSLARTDGEETARGQPLPAARADPREMYRSSTAAAQEGDYTRAVIRLFSATMAALDVRGIVAAVPSATVNDVRWELRKVRAPQAPAFEAIARPFGAAAYAERPIREAEWVAARDAFIALFGPNPQARA